MRVGVVTAPHGLKGEVKVYPTTDDPARFKKLQTVILKQGGRQSELHILQVRFFKQLVILQFQEISSVEEASLLRQGELYVTREQAVPLGPDENYVADLLGCRVITDEGQFLGEVVDVLFTGANDVYVVKSPERKEVLLPAIKSCILQVIPEKKEMKVHLLPGLLDL